MNEIRVTVTGPVKTGKSTILALIKKTLVENGIVVSHDPRPDYEDVEYFDAVMENIDTRIKVISKVSSISLEEKHENGGI